MQPRSLNAAAVAGAIVAACVLGALALSSVGASGRAALLSQLQRPATAWAVAPAPAPFQRRLRAGPASIDLRIAPNRASVRNAISIVLGGTGRALASISFSMPTMNMWDAFELGLARDTAGSYSALMPAVGMPGLWRLRVRLARPGAAPVVVTVDDRLAA